MSNDFGGIDLSQLMKIAGSPAGQELIALIQNNKDAQFDEAMQQAQAGDFSKVQEALSRMLSNPEAQDLLDQIRGGK